MAAKRNHLPDQPSSGDRLELLRELVVEAGLEVLDRDGLGLATESITYAGAFAYLADEFDIRVTRGSVHGRIWASQEDFRRDVLSSAAQHASPYENSSAMHDAIVGMLTQVDRLDVDRRQRVWAFCRLGGRSLLNRYLHSDTFRRFQAIKAAARPGDDPLATSALRALVRENADGNRDERVRRFSFMFDGLGLRPRPELGLEPYDAVDLFMTLMQILLTGAHLDHHAGFEVMASKVQTDLPADEENPWTYVGFAFLATVEALFEDDPDVQVPSPGGYPSAEEIAPLASRTPGPPLLSTLVNGRPRRSKDELRELVLAAGVHLFLQEGLRLRAESLTYAAVFDHVKRTRGITVHRSTVHNRIWSSQEDFRAEILAEAARYGTGESIEAVRQAMAAQTVTRNPDNSINVRQLILDNSLATMSAQLVVAATSPTFNRWQSIKATMLSEQPVDNADSIRQAVSRRYEDMLSVLGETYRSVIPLVGLVVNPELRMSEEQAYHLFNAICATLSSGAEYNVTAGARLAERKLPVPRADGSGECDEWPIPAIGTLAVLDLIFVPES